MAIKSYEEVFEEVKTFLKKETNVYEENNMSVKENIAGYTNTIFIVDGEHYTALEVMTGLQHTYTIKVFYGVSHDFQSQDDPEKVIDNSRAVQGNDFVLWSSDGTLWGNIQWKLKKRSQEESRRKIKALLLSWESGEIQGK